MPRQLYLTRNVIGSFLTSVHTVTFMMSAMKKGLASLNVLLIVASELRRKKVMIFDIID